MVNIAKLGEDLDNLYISKSNNIVDKFGEFNYIKVQLQEYDTLVQSYP